MLKRYVYVNLLYLMTEELSKSHLSFNTERAKEVVEFEMISVFHKFWSAKFKDNKDLEIHNILKPMLFVVSLLGLLPHSVKYSKSKRNYKIIPKSIYLNCVYGFAILVIILLFLVEHIRLVFAPIHFETKIMTQINYTVELITFFIFCCTVYFCAFLNRSKYIKILKILVSTWTNIPSCDKSRNVLEKLRFHRNIMLMGLIMISIIQIYVNVSQKTSVWQKFLVGVSFDLPQVIQLALHAFFTTLVLSVSTILRNISDNCQLFENNKYKMYTTVEVRPKVKNIMTLREMELMYMNAVEIKTYINDIFECPMLASILQSFHALVGEGYTIYDGTLIKKSITTYELLDCSVWIVYQIIKVYSLSYSGSLLKLEALKIGQALHYIPTEKQDLRHLMEVQHFSTLLKYQPVEINLYGFFSLDAKLMFNLFASATMYLIILVQFE